MTVRRIFDEYREPDKQKKSELKAELNSAYLLQDVTIRMVGVWDSVGALGIPGIFFNLFNQKKYGFLDTALHPCVEHACHAVSIDERRAQFKSTLWTNPGGSFRPNDEQVEHVWFAGVHSDVGGGYQECDLSDITFSWMKLNICLPQRRSIRFRGFVWTRFIEPRTRRPGHRRQQNVPMRAALSPTPVNPSRTSTVRCMT